MLSTSSAERVALGVAGAVSVALLGFEWLEPSGSLGVTRDLRLTDVRRLALMLTIVSWVCCLALARRWPRRPSARSPSPLAAWLAVLLVSARLAPIYQTQALAFVRDMLLCVVFGWAVYDLARTSSRQVLLARALALCGMGVAGFGLAEAGAAGIADWLHNFRYQAGFSVGDVLRVSSTLPHPNIAAMLLGLCLPLQLAWLVSTRSPRPGRLVLGLGAAGATGRAGAQREPCRHRRRGAGAGRHAAGRDLAESGAFAAGRPSRRRSRCPSWSGSPSPASRCCCCTGSAKRSRPGIARTT